jgi:hypothetical protein
MKFLQYNLGSIRSDNTIEVSLNKSANVRVLTPNNLIKYKKGIRYDYFGGLANTSPFMVKVPTSGTWHAVIDMNGLAGSTEASVRVI